MGNLNCAIHIFIETRQLDRDEQKSSSNATIISKHHTYLEWGFGLPTNNIFSLVISATREYWLKNGHN